MVRPLPARLLLIPVAFSLSGCLALSFGGKSIANTCTDEVRLLSLEARVQALEQRLEPNPPPNPPPSGTVEIHTPAN